MEYRAYNNFPTKEKFINREQALQNILRNIDYFYLQIEKGNLEVIKFLVSIYKNKDITNEMVKLGIESYKELKKNVLFPWKHMLRSDIFEAYDENKTKGQNVKEYVLLYILRNIDYFYYKIERGNPEAVSFLLSALKDEDVSAKSAKEALIFYNNLKRYYPLPWSKMIRSYKFN